MLNLFITLHLYLGSRENKQRSIGRNVKTEDYYSPTRWTLASPPPSQSRHVTEKQKQWRQWRPAVAAPLPVLYQPKGFSQHHLFLAPFHSRPCVLVLKWLPENRGLNDPSVRLSATAAPRHVAHSWMRSLFVHLFVFQRCRRRLEPRGRAPAGAERGWVQMRSTKAWNEAHQNFARR